MVDENDVPNHPERRKVVTPRRASHDRRKPNHRVAVADRRRVHDNPKADRRKPERRAFDKAHPVAFVERRVAKHERRKPVETPEQIERRKVLAHLLPVDREKAIAAANG